MSNPYGQKICTKHSHGLGIKEYWVYMFQQNEKLWRETPAQARTDEDLSQEVLRAFPDRSWSKGMVATARHRAAYNRGLYTLGEKPQPPAGRYERKLNALIRFGPDGRITGVHNLEIQPLQTGSNAHEKPTT